MYALNIIMDMDFKIRSKKRDIKKAFRNGTLDIIKFVFDYPKATRLNSVTFTSPEDLRCSATVLLLSFTNT